MELGILDGAAVAQQSQTAPAFVVGDQVWTRGEVLAEIDQKTIALDRAGIAARAVVALRTRKSPALVATIAALAGRGNGILLLPSGIGSELSETLTQTAGARYELVVDDAELAAVEKGAPTGGGHHHQLILPTSGSTGRPKLVPLTFGAVERFLAWSSKFFDIGPDSRVWSYAPLNFDLSLLEVWSTLAAGGTVIAPPEHEIGNGADLAARLSAGRPHLVQAVPFFYRLVLPHLREPVAATRHVVITGESFESTLLDQVLVAFPNALVHNVYGSTETNDSLVHTFDPRDNQPSAIPVGRALRGARAVLLDNGDHLVVGAGEGELATSTPFQTAGYLGGDGPDRFVRLDPDDRGRVYFRTGDVVRRDVSGVHYLLARAQHLVKVRGVRTNVLDVEATIAAAPGVEEAAVIAVPHDTEGHALHAFVVSETRLDPIALRSHIATRLPRTALPSAFTFTHTPLPKTGNGKTDRNQLRKDTSPS